MILQDEFKKSGYTDILIENTATEYGINLEDIFDLNKKPEELISIFISDKKDELFFLLNGDMAEINTLCDCWDNRIRVFTIINGESEVIHKLKYNIIQLIVYSGDDPDKNREGNLMVSRKIIIKGDVQDKNQIVIDDDEGIELPFHMISTDTFAPDEERKRQLEELLPKDEELLLIMEKKRIKAHKREHEGKYDKSFETQEYEMIKGWLER